MDQDAPIKVVKEEVKVPIVSLEGINELDKISRAVQSATGLGETLDVVKDVLQKEVAIAGEQQIFLVDGRVWLDAVESQKLPEEPAPKARQVTIDKREDEPRKDVAEDTKGCLKQCKVKGEQPSQEEEAETLAGKLSQLLTTGYGKDKDNVYDIYPVSVAYKIYKSALVTRRCKRFGDGSFFHAKRTRTRLLRDFPIRVEDELKLLPCAFEKDAQRV